MPAMSFGSTSRRIMRPRFKQTIFVKYQLVAHLPVHFLDRGPGVFRVIADL